MLRFMIKLPFRIIAAPVWLVLAAVNIVLWNQYGLDNEISDYYDSSVCSTPTYRYGDSCSN